VFFPWEVPPEKRAIVILILRETLYSGTIIYLILVIITVLLNRENTRCKK
jgi:hypothetical protein